MYEEHYKNLFLSTPIRGASIDVFSYIILGGSVCDALTCFPNNSTRGTYTTTPVSFITLPNPKTIYPKSPACESWGGGDITKTRREDRWLYGAFRPKKRERVRMFVQETPPIERETFVFLTYIRISEGVCVARTRLRPELADKLDP